MQAEFESGAAWAANETVEPYVWFAAEDDRMAGLALHGDPSRLRWAAHRALKVRGGELALHVDPSRLWWAAHRALKVRGGGRGRGFWPCMVTTGGRQS